MPIRVGSRLEQLYLLRDRIAYEIRVEELKAVTSSNGATPRSTPPVAKSAAYDVTNDRLAQLGVSARDVKVWAHGQGLIDHVPRGRLNPALLDAYAAAHPTPQEDIAS